MRGVKIPGELTSEAGFNEEGTEYSDGSRAMGAHGDMVSAGATRSKDLFLGRYATVMDAEEFGVTLAWATADRVVLDSKGAIARICSLSFTRARSWIEEEIQGLIKTPKQLM